jgi:hypothetical protein
MASRTVLLASLSVFLSIACGSSPAPSRFASAEQSLSAAAPAFGSAANYEVIAGTRLTCTNSALSGSVAVWPGTTPDVVQTSCPISGSIEQGSGNAQTAYNDFLTAYAAFAQTSCDHALATLDGQVLAPGVYCFDAAATSTGGVLTLNGPSNGSWIFKIGTLGTGALTGTNFSVVMADGTPPPCGSVYWWVSEAVTLTDSSFVGTLLAGGAITLTRGTFAGDAFSKAAVTITGSAATACTGIGGTGRDAGDDDGDDDHGRDHDRDGGHHKRRCNQGVGHGGEDCDPGNSDDHHSSNDEDGGSPGNPGRKH